MAEYVKHILDMAASIDETIPLVEIPGVREYIRTIPTKDRDISREYLLVVAKMFRDYVSHTEDPTVPFSKRNQGPFIGIQRMVIRMTELSNIL